MSREENVPFSSTYLRYEVAYIFSVTVHNLKPNCLLVYARFALLARYMLRPCFHPSYASGLGKNCVFRPIEKSAD